MAWIVLRVREMEKFAGYVREFSPEIELYWPEMMKIVRPAGCRRTRRVKVPVFPGYVFADVDLGDGECERLIRCPYKVRVMRFDGSIEVVSLPVIEELKRMEMDGGWDEVDVKRGCSYRLYDRVVIRWENAVVPGVIVRLIAGSRVIVQAEFAKMVVPVHALNGVGR